jgi:hypothetical protein
MTKRCFVIQGFGKKQDYEQGKQFNLDASYAVIKEAIEEAGLECYRADELRTNALIDQVMYDQLLDADLVVADITTLNFNAAYELGVRYALRPHATLVVGESGMNFPFDVNHVYIHGYKHLGEDIGYSEVKRFQAELKELAQKAISQPQKDSPVYTFLRRLPENGYLDVTQQEEVKTVIPSGGTTLRDVSDQANKAMDEGRFSDAIPLWEKAREIAVKDDFIVQQLALATYKSKQPDPELALLKAKEILKYLQPSGSFDTETLGIWASVHKRLYEISKDPDDLDEAIFGLERGFFIRQDHYTGINFAFMLDVKASLRTDPGETAELHAVAGYVRRKVVDLCKTALASGEFTDEQKYWVMATLYEAYFGLGKDDDAEKWKTEAFNLPVPDWMFQSTQEQIERLRKLLDNS